MQVIEENLHTKNSHTVPTFNVHCVPRNWYLKPIQ